MFSLLRMGADHSYTPRRLKHVSCSYLSVFHLLSLWVKVAAVAVYNTEAQDGTKIAGSWFTQTKCRNIRVLRVYFLSISATDILLQK